MVKECLIESKYTVSKINDLIFIFTILYLLSLQTGLPFTIPRSKCNSCKLLFVLQKKHLKLSRETQI